MQRRILFVDDEPNVLAGLRRMMFQQRDRYDCQFANGAEEAIAALEKQPFDVVISDMRMPGIDGAGLLNEVMRRWPACVRIVLSGQSDRETILRSIGPTHQFLSKPTDSVALLQTIERSCALRDILNDAKLKSLVSGMTALPIRPETYVQVEAELKDENASIIRLGQLIEHDLGMAAKVLQLVNSSYFGLPQRVRSVHQAVSMLGLDTIKAIFFSKQVFTQFEAFSVKGLNLESASQHCLLVGSLARSIARKEGLGQRVEDDAMMAGVLHDLGKLVLAVNLDGQYQEILEKSRSSGVPLHRVEDEALGLTHAEVGAFLLGLWGLPDTVVEAVALHHDPTSAVGRGFEAHAALHAADCLTNRLHPLPGLPGGVTEFSPPFCAAYCQAGKAEAWAALAVIPQTEDADE